MWIYNFCVDLLVFIPIPARAQYIYTSKRRGYLLFVICYVLFVIICYTNM